MTALLEDVREEVKILKGKAVEDVKALKDPEKTQLYKSIFRVKHDDKPRSRALGILSNVFLHLHPAKINRDAVAYNFTWGMGGITFYLFIVLTFTLRLSISYAAEVLRESTSRCPSCSDSIELMWK